MSRPRLPLAIALAALLPSLAASAHTKEDQPSTSGSARSARAHLAAITADDAKETIKVLASPEYEGRGALTEGLVKAGDYVAGRFRAAGLRPGGDGGTYFQAVDVAVGKHFGAATHLDVGGTRLELKKDYWPNTSSAQSSGIGGVIFAGYGITVAPVASPGVEAPANGKKKGTPATPAPIGYDDYDGIDARGKLVVVLRYAPRYDAKSQDSTEKLFHEKAGLAIKLENAVKHGAVALAVVDPPAQGEGSIESLSLGIPSRASNIASFHLSRAAADRLLAPSSKTVEALQKQIDGTQKPASFVVPAAAAFAVQRVPVKSRNVVAILPGSDPALASEAIVIGAHYDHLGKGDEGGALDGKPELHPGADDNGSGTTAVIEIADLLGGEAQHPRRSIVFMTFTGEEKGLIGSAFAASHPPTGLKPVAMINLDMVGRMKDGKLEVGGAPTAADWQPLVEAANEEKIALTFPKAVVPNSDHASFLLKNVPALFLFTGLHPDYHRATDTWDKVNYEGLAKSARLAARVARAVADKPVALAFIPPKWTSMGAMGSGQGVPSIRIGVMFDYAFEGGAKIETVMPSGAANAAGLKGGDIIRDIGGAKVGSVSEYMEALGKHKYGDEVTFTVERDGARVPIKVKLTPPAGGEGGGPRGPGGRP